MFLPVLSLPFNQPGFASDPPWRLLSTFYSTFAGSLLSHHPCHNPNILFSSSTRHNGQLLLLLCVLRRLMCFLGEAQQSVAEKSLPQGLATPCQDLGLSNLQYGFQSSHYVISLINRGRRRLVVWLAPRKLWRPVLPLSSVCVLPFVALLNGTIYVSGVGFDLMTISLDLMFFRGSWIYA